MFSQTEELGAFVVFISTDYVFDGTSPPYQVTDQTNPLNKYGFSKREGEVITLDSSKGIYRQQSDYYSCILAAL